MSTSTRGLYQEISQRTKKSVSVPRNTGCTKKSDIYEGAVCGRWLLMNIQFTWCLRQMFKVGEPECNQGNANLEGGKRSGKMSRNLAPRGLSHKHNNPPERKSRINGRLIRKYTTIKNLLFSTRNVVAVQEDMGQFNDLFKMLLGAYEEYNALLEDEARLQEDEWFDEIGKRKIT